MPESPLHLIAINIGNTNTQLALFDDAALVRTLIVPSDDPGRVGEAAESLASESTSTGDSRRGIVIASVNAKAAEPIENAVKDRVNWPGPYLIGRDLEIPMQGRLEPESMTGHDRVLAALAAFDTIKQAVVVVDAGTAITVDFVDGEGVFHGGAIAPGVRMALRALHANTAALPELEFDTPGGEVVFGRNTAQAMINGAYYGARGLVRILVERYAEAYDAYPLVIATGGDARSLFENDELVDRIADDLVLRGIALTCRRMFATAEADLEDED